MRRRARVVSWRDFYNRVCERFIYNVLFTVNWAKSGFKSLFQIPVIEVQEFDETIISRLQATNSDIIFSSGHTRIIPQSILATARIGAYNTHPSLLPEYAGNNPWFWILKNGETKSGVTIHKMSSDVDLGDIVCQKLFQIPKGCSYSKLYSISLRNSVSLIKEFTNALVNNTISPSPQNIQRRSYYKIPRDKDYRILWSQTAEEIVHLICASSPSPGAYTFLDKIEIRVLSAHQGEQNRNASFGSIFNWNSSYIVVQCGKNTTLKISSISIDGKRVSIRYFIAVIIKKEVQIFV